jgi:hypothetical protein
VCDGSVFTAAVLHAVRQSAVALQSVSESIQNGLKFRLTFHSSTFFRPEEAALWLDWCKNTDHKAVVFVSPSKRFHSLDQLCNSVVYHCANIQCESLWMKEISSCASGF